MFYLFLLLFYVALLGRRFFLLFSLFFFVCVCVFVTQFWMIFFPQSWCISYASVLRISYVTGFWTNFYVFRDKSERKKCTTSRKKWWSQSKSLLMCWNCWMWYVNTVPCQSLCSVTMTLFSMNKWLYEEITLFLAKINW